MCTPVISDSEENMQRNILLIPKSTAASCLNQKSYDSEMYTACLTLPWHSQLAYLQLPQPASSPPLCRLHRVWEWPGLNYKIRFPDGVKVTFNELVNKAKNLIILLLIIFKQTNNQM